VSRPKTKGGRDESRRDPEQELEWETRAGGTARAGGIARVTARMDGEKDRKSGSEWDSEGEGEGTMTTSRSRMKVRERTACQYELQDREKKTYYTQGRPQSWPYVCNIAVESERSGWPLEVHERQGWDGREG
jgi:hypothetical protein